MYKKTRWVKKEGWRTKGGREEKREKEEGEGPYTFSKRVLTYMHIIQICAGKRHSVLKRHVALMLRTTVNRTHTLGMVRGTYGIGMRLINGPIPTATINDTHEIEGLRARVD